MYPARLALVLEGVVPAPAEAGRALVVVAQALVLLVPQGMVLLVPQGMVLMVPQVRQCLEQVQELELTKVHSIVGTCSLV